MVNLEDAKRKIGGKFQLIADNLNSIVEQLEIEEEAKILDIGTGDGKMFLTLSLNGHRVITGEPKDDNSKYAKQDWYQNAIKAEVEHFISFKFFRVEDLPFEDAHFDYIFTYGSFHHFNDKIKALQEMARVIKKEGKIVIIEPNSQMAQRIQKEHPEHPNMENPKNYTKGLGLIVNVSRYRLVDAYIIEKV